MEQASLAITPQDKVLARFRADLDRVYGPRIERVVLFGSRARGDARPDPDYDIAIFLHEPLSLRQEEKQIAWAATEILHDTDAVLNPLTFAAGAWSKRTAFMAELRRDGIDP